MAGPSKHHLFGGSNAKQVRQCPASIAMRQRYPDNASSPAAAEGTRLHALMEHCLRNGECDASSYIGLWLEDEDRNLPTFTKEQCDAVTVALDYVAGLMAQSGAELYVETALTLYDIDPDAGGTGDVFVLTPERGYQIDAKFGRMPVDVENNDQCMHYLAGWRRKLGDRMPLDITMAIIQPRAPGADGPVKTADTDLIAVMEWETKYAEAIAAARAPNASPVAGDHCSFCPGTLLGDNGRYRCEAFDARTTAARDAAFDLTGDMRAVQTLDAAMLGKRYSELSILKKYIRDMEAFVKTRAREELPAGYAWAPGGRNWKWRGAEGDVFDLVRVLHGDVAARELVKLITPIQAEKSLEPAVFADIADLVDKSTAAPQLVKKGARKNELSLSEVRDYFTANRDDAFDAFE